MARDADDGDADPDSAIARDDPAAATDTDTHDEAEGEVDTERPVRRGAVDLRTRDGERITHDDAYVRYEPDAFVVALDPSFDDEVRYSKTSLAWIEVRHPRW